MPWCSLYRPCSCRAAAGVAADVVCKPPPTHPPASCQLLYDPVLSGYNLVRFNAFAVNSIYSVLSVAVSQQAMKWA